MRAVTQRKAHLIGGALLSGGQELAALLPHVILLLHRGELLVLGEAEGKWDAEEEGAGGDDPGRLAAKGEGGPGGRGGGVELGRDPTARRGRDDIP